jgi:hypothetical protein
LRLISSTREAAGSSDQRKWKPGLKSILYPSLVNPPRSRMNTLS